MAHLPRTSWLVRVLDSIYQRTPRGIARLCVASAAGAVIAIYVAMRNNGAIAGQNWYIFTGCGLMIGLVGGATLGVLEQREATGQGPPLWWTVLRNVTRTFLQLLALCLVVGLFYVMYRLVHDEHLYGF